MNKVIVVTSTATSVYNITAGKTAAGIAAASGVTDPDFYQEFAETDFDAACYNFNPAFSLSGGVVNFSLSVAKEVAKQQEKFEYSPLEAAATEGYSVSQLASQASLDPVNRLPDVQVVLDAVNVLAVQLNNNLIAIDAATTIDEVNNIVNPPTGVISIGRGDGIGGPEDLNLSYFVEFNSVSLTPAETELFVPGTSSIVPYDGGLPSPYTFNAVFGIFNPGDYELQIRVAATSQVIATVVVPFGSNQNISF